MILVDCTILTKDQRLELNQKIKYWKDVRYRINKTPLHRELHLTCGWLGPTILHIIEEYVEECDSRVENDITDPFSVCCTNNCCMPNHKDNLFFTDEEHNEIETIKKATGLNWHDFILDAARLYSR